MKKKLVLYAGLFGLLFSSKYALDKNTDMFESKIVAHAMTEHDDNLQIVAHRGYSCLFPDNTLSGIEVCNDINCIDGIEIDVRLTKDDKLLLFHDNRVLFRNVCDYTYDELLKGFIHGYLYKKHYTNNYSFNEFNLVTKRYERMLCQDALICTLEDVLKCRSKDKFLVIDLKFSGYHDNVLINKVGQLLEHEENFMIQSFDSDCLKRMKFLFPNYQYQLLVGSNTQLEDIDYSFDAYGIKYDILGEEDIEKIIDHNKKVSFWTVDSYSDFAKLNNEYNTYNDDIYYISDNPDMICYQYRLEQK